MTDIDGEVFQHVEYFPFGETWVEEHSNRQRTPYLFTGKELDEDTQLYYFGARYYDPRTSVWQSPDPMLGNYLFGGPAGGVHAPANLNVYGYVHQRPVVATDPDGEFLNFLVGAAAGAVIDLGVQGVLVATGVQDNISWASVGVAAASGASGVGLSSVVAKNAARVGASQAVARGATLTGETAIGVGEQIVRGEDINVTEAAAGALIGEAAGEAAGALLRRGDVGDAAETAAEQVDNSVQAPNNMVSGTNERGELTSRSSFRNGTVQDAWDNATDGPTGGKLCPTCGGEVSVAPGTGNRDWDVSHNPSWTNREFDANVTTRQDVIDNYQQGTSLECPSCNRSGQANDNRFNE